MLTNLFVMAWIAVSYGLYYLIGKLSGSLRYGDLIRRIVIIALFVYNSVVNFGGIENLIWAYREVPGFAGGQAIAVVGMLLTSRLGSHKPLLIGKKKYLI